MNSTCPSCGVLYNVAAKDIGRRLKCKKCSAPLAVTDAGLVRDESPPPAERHSLDAEPEPRRRRLGLGFDPLALVGEIPGVLFGIGVVLVLFFTFLQVLSAASNLRAAEYSKKVALAEEIEIRELLPPDKKDSADLEPDKRKDYDEKKKKIEDRYFLKKKIADEEKRATEIGNRRTLVLEGYGTMFGFMFVAFGCLGFLRTQQPMILRIVAGIILTGMILGLFKLALGTGAGIGAGVNIG
ncbi:MAG TPA: hypothetical protein VGE74_24065 [Gemmata sp.]